MIKRKHLILSLFAIISLTLVSCGNSSEKVKTKEEYEDIAPKVVLVEDDFDSDWESEPEDDSDSGEDEGVEECLFLDDKKDPIYEYTGDSFSRYESGSENVAVFSRVAFEESSKEVDKLLKAYSSDKFKDCFEKYAEDEMKNDSFYDDAEVEAKLSENNDIDFKGVDGEAVRVLVSHSGSDGDFYLSIDMILFGHKNSRSDIMVVTLSEKEPDSDLAKELLEKMSTRIKEEI